MSLPAAANRMRAPTNPRATDQFTAHKDNVCSLRSMKCLFARLSLTLRSALSARNRRRRSQLLSQLPRAVPDAHAGAVANATMPRHRAASSVVRTASPAALSLQRARWTVSPVRESRLQFTCTDWRMVLARCQGRENSALTRLEARASFARPGSWRVSAARGARRPHAAGHIEASRASSRSCDITRRSFAAALSRLPLTSARQTAGFGVAVCSGYCAHACAPVPPLHCHAKHRRLSCASSTDQARVTPSFQLRCTSLRTALAIGA